MLYQNALVLFGFWVIYYKTICCEVNLEREKGGTSFRLKWRKRKRLDRGIGKGNERVGREQDVEGASRDGAEPETARWTDGWTEGPTGAAHRRGVGKVGAAAASWGSPGPGADRKPAQLPKGMRGSLPLS